VKNCRRGLLFPRLSSASLSLIEAVIDLDTIRQISPEIRKTTKELDGFRHLQIHFLHI
jgi:hypothetical protein